MNPHAASATPTMTRSTPTPKSYYRAAAALLVMLVLTVAASMLHLGSFGVVVALGIAFGKAFVIALVFMHVAYSSRLTRLFAAAGVFWLLLLFVLTFGDYLTR